MENQIKIAKVINPFNNEPPSGIVFFLHGLGASGEELFNSMKNKMPTQQFGIPHLKLIFLTAPKQPLTIDNGKKLNIWFDIFGISKNCPDHRESTDSTINQLIKLIHQQMKENNLPLNRILIGGHSMGGTMSMQLAYRFLPNLAGVFTLSSFLTDKSLVYDSLNETKYKKDWCPLLMIHGTKDDVVPFEWGQEAFDNLIKYNVNGTFVKNDSDHNISLNSLKTLFIWINEIFSNAS